MAAAHGSNAHVTVDADVLVGASVVYLDQFSLDKIIETAEVTAIGNDDKQYIAGLRDSTLSLSGSWDATQDGFLADWDDGAVVSCVVGPDGNTTGKVRYTFNALITNYSISSPVGDKVAWSASLQRTGATTRDVYP